MLRSVPFGEFDPLKPCTIPGIFAQNLYAEPVVIGAPLALVWEIMTGFDRYPEWNPLNRYFHLDTRAQAGEMVSFGPSWGPYDREGLPETDLKQHERLTVWEENSCLAYAEIACYLNAERVQHISPLDASRTRYQTYERMSGILAPLVKRLYGKRVLDGFRANGLALKRRAEQLA
jgi:hypothetical protein